MATAVSKRTVLPYRFGRAGMRVEGVVAVTAALLLAITLYALWRGRDGLAGLDWPITLHLLTLIPALALTPFLFLGTKGAAAHRALGYIWCALMVGTAVASLFIRSLNPTGFTWVHVFSIATFVSTPRLILHARRRKWRTHRWIAIGLTSGALLVAGVTAYMGERHLRQWVAA